MIYDFQGRPIRLPWERWLHIIDPHGDHPYMVHWREELEETLKEPDLIIQSTVTRSLAGYTTSGMKKRSWEANGSGL